MNKIENPQIEEAKMSQETRKRPQRIPWTAIERMEASRKFREQPDDLYANPQLQEEFSNAPLTEEEAIEAEQQSEGYLSSQSSHVVQVLNVRKWIQVRKAGYPGITEKDLYLPAHLSQEQKLTKHIKVRDTVAQAAISDKDWLKFTGGENFDSQEKAEPVKVSLENFQPSGDLKEDFKALLEIISGRNFDSLELPQGLKNAYQKSDTFTLDTFFLVLSDVGQDYDFTYGPPLNTPFTETVNKALKKACGNVWSKHFQGVLQKESGSQIDERSINGIGRNWENFPSQKVAEAEAGLKQIAELIYPVLQNGGQLTEKIYREALDVIMQFAPDETRPDEVLETIIFRLSRATQENPGVPLKTLVGKNKEWMIARQKLFFSIEGESGFSIDNSDPDFGSVSQPGSVKASVRTGSDRARQFHENIEGVYISLAKRQERWVENLKNLKVTGDIIRDSQAFFKTNGEGHPSFVDMIQARPFYDRNPEGIFGLIKIYIREGRELVDWDDPGVTPASKRWFKSFKELFYLERKVALKIIELATKAYKEKTSKLSRLEVSGDIDKDVSKYLLVLDFGRSVDKKRFGKLWIATGNHDNTKIYDSVKKLLKDKKDSLKQAPSELRLFLETETALLGKILKKYEERVMENSLAA